MMRKIFICLLAIGMLGFNDCGSKEEPTPDDPVVDPKEEVINGLSKTWSVNSVSLDGTDITDDWTGFTLSFTKNQQYTAKKLSDASILVWPENGSYTIPNANNPKTVLRDDGVQIVLSNISASSVRLSFTISGRSSGGRVESLIGDYVFDMK